MWKNGWRPLGKQNNDKKAVAPIALFLAALVGAAVALAAVLCIRGAKGKKASGRKNAGRAKSGGRAAERDRAPREIVPRELLIENPQQIKPYRPRKRVSAKKVFGRAVAMTAAAALLLTGFYMAPNDSVPVPTVQARESFGGIKQVVREHEEEPFVILDIVPGVAQVEVNGNTYEFSLGTIGYLAPGQSPIQQDFSRIFTGDDKESFYKYPDRKALTDSVIGSGYDGITYQEAYGGTGENLKASVWSRISTVLAGPVFNFLLAFIIALTMVNMTGIIAIRDAVASQVAEGGGAQAAGLQDGDRIVSINGEKMHLFDEVSLYMQLSYTGGDLEVVYERGGNEYTATVTPQYDEASGSYLLGIYNAEFVQPK